MNVNLGRLFNKSAKPKASEVLTYHLKHNKPIWTSYFVKYVDVVDDQKGMSHFNWLVDDYNYIVLRTGCFPYIKYHCSKSLEENLILSNRMMNLVKCINLGIPALLYGIAAIFLITHEETVSTPNGNVTIYFLLKEVKGSRY